MSFVSSRIENWPYTKYHRRLLVIGGLGYTFDAMDAAVLAFILPVLRAQWALTSVQTGVLASATYIGFFFGALSAGALGDLCGRRRVMMYALAIYAVASLVSATTTSWTGFLAARIIAGIGTGAESAIIAPYLTEFVAKRYRGAFVGALTGFFSFGFVAAAGLGYFIIPSIAQGWRVVVIITALPVVMLLWWRRVLDESPRWLESRGRHNEAREIVMKIEAELALDCQRSFVECEPIARQIDEHVGKPTFVSNFKALWSGKQARVTAMTWAMWLSITFSYYLFFTWIPGLLVQNGMSITKSFGYSFVIYLAQVPGLFSAAYLNEKIGRKATIVLYMALGAVSALALSAMRTNEAVMIAGACLSFAMNGTYAGVYAYTAEIFPTAIRTTGAGFASAVGRVGAIASPIIVGYLFPIFGFAGVFGLTTVALGAGALAVMILGPRTKGLSLEAIVAEEFQ
ncbi:putative MFS transporter [Paraburkholderia sp. BL18I3N2]|uniref:MFS transporter n=1 Tax=Paraburkholderia sp. BL18I3N2 TaxID=1938799 RepID=UPI000D0767C9|nr:MFS transporter [Paraburkholderia sp. BL18I3N2]PRX21618.1 putative MFS transporter [Paraburkholderia sp. BL18I3N2]